MGWVFKNLLRGSGDLPVIVCRGEMLATMFLISALCGKLGDTSALLGESLA